MNPEPPGPFRIRQPLPFGRSELWPGEHATLASAIGEIERVGNTAAEVINQAGEIIFHSRLWWKKATAGKDGRP